MKKLIEKIRVRLIKKLGGYTEEQSVKVEYNYWNSIPISADVLIGITNDTYAGMCREAENLISAKLAHLMLDRGFIDIKDLTDENDDYMRYHIFRGSVNIARKNEFKREGKPNEKT